MLTSKPNKSIETWSCQDVSEFLTSLSLDVYSPIFLKNRIDGTCLLLASHEMLNELSIASVGHRMKLINAVYKQKKECSIAFAEGDYIATSSVDSFAQRVDLISRSVHEKGTYESHPDNIIVALKERLHTAKGELSQYKSTAPPPGKLRLVTQQFHNNVSPILSSTSDFTKIRIYGNHLSGRETESYKTFRIGKGDDTVKVITEALAKYKISDDWRNYILLLSSRDHENPLSPTDKVVDVLSKHVVEEDVPAFILQNIRHVNNPRGPPLDLAPGTYLANSLGVEAVSTAIGIYDYVAQSSQEINIQIGAIFSVLARDGDWTVVDFQGHRGSVPTGMIYDLDQADKSYAHKNAICQHDYARKSRYELSVQRGDRLILHERYHHWILAQHVGMLTDEEDAMGLLPISHIILCPNSPGNGRHSIY